MLQELIEIHPAVLPALSLLVLLVVAVIADLVIKQILLRLVARVVRGNDLKWDDILQRHNVAGRVAQAIPALIIYSGIEWIPSLNEDLAQLLRNVSLSYIVLVVTISISAMLSAANEIYELHPSAKTRPLRGFVQLLQIVIYIIGAVLIISALIDRSPLLLLSGFGAMTAILLLVFKDTILGLVASVQLNANDMVRVGDWIEMPKFGADGDVIEVNLHTVKVQNFDRTITTIPTHTLIADSFKNWRGMSESGGRRIKRAVLIDQSTIRFLTDEEVADFERFYLLRDYLSAKREELEAALDDVDEDVQRSSAVNRRRLTNIGTYRAYVSQYLKQHPSINPDATTMVRQLPPDAQGLPLEIYCFTRTTEWLPYEAIQADVFDHVIAITPEFGLRLFQEPAGSDLSSALAAVTTQAQQAPGGESRSPNGGSDED
ncbi:MAG TPA: mechanosensitive ion channel family protein [Gammaproteobacteria bacterium]|nr:mechanosensitive ion channel family protein [Gammaproteobacteria bacterium]